MTIYRINEDIHKVINNVPEHELPQLSNHINSIAAKYPTKDDLYKFVDRVFKEDDGLLRGLSNS